MAEQQSRENSVLFSLRELRRMEDDRIRQEQTEAQARAEAERRAREDAERRAREEVERRRTEEEDRLRRNEEAKVAREREEQMRLQEAERRARVEGEMRLQEERMRLEVSQRKARSPMPAILGFAVVMCLLGGGVIYKLHAANEEALAAARAEQDRIAENARKKAEEVSRQFQASINSLQKQLDSAKTEEERVRLRLEMAKAQQSRQAPAGGRPREAAKPTETAPAVKPPSVKEKKNIDNDPLGGIKL